MDIGDLKPVERTIEIKHPGDPNVNLGIRVSLISLDDERTKSTRRRIANKRILLEQRGKHFMAEDLEKNAYQVAFGAMAGWDWYGDDIEFKGEKPDFTERNVLEVFATLPWFLKQIQEELNEEKDFFQK